MTECLPREEKIVEEIRGILDEENETFDVEIAERSENMPIKPSSQEVFRAIETLMDYSLFKKSGEIGNLAAKVSSMVENENICKKQKNNFFNKY